MQKLKPKMDAIKKKYKDPRKQQQETMALMKKEKVSLVPGGCMLAFVQMPIWISLYEVLQTTFEMRHAGTRLGWLAPDARWPLEARAPDGREVSRELFREREGRLELAQARVPIMVTTEVAIARSDCLFYLVQPGRD